LSLSSCASSVRFSSGSGGSGSAIIGKGTPVPVG
jgi:hypothetical protein